MTFTLLRARPISAARKIISTKSLQYSIASVRANHSGIGRTTDTVVSRTPPTANDSAKAATCQLSDRRAIESARFTQSPNCFGRNSTVQRRNLATTSRMFAEPTVHELFEPATGSWQYVVADPTSSRAVIIDPVLNYDAAKCVISTESADELIKIVTEKSYKVEMVLETHIHADHITAASYIQATLAKDQGHKPLLGVGRRIRNTQNMFGERYGIAPSEYENVFDRMWEDDEDFNIGSLTARAIHLPGHTPDHMGYKIGGNVFVGDSIFHVDIGSARADFPGGSAEAVYNSGRKLLALPDDTKVWVGHDYPPEGRSAPVPFVTVKQQREENKHLKDGIREADFVEMRRKRDSTLAAPRLMHPSLQMNIRGGRLPAPTASGLRMVHLPLQVPGTPW